jgi:hypothetical protein
VARAGIRHYRLEFVHESGEQVRQVAAAFRGALDGGLSATELKQPLQRITPQGVTEGSLFVKFYGDSAVGVKISQPPAHSTPSESRRP